MRLLICADIHFFAPRLHPGQLFSKEIIGNLNALISFRRKFCPSYADALVSKLSRLHITHALILGDLTTTGSKKEFALARRFINELQQKGITVFALPGNHDQYTEEACRERRFYHMLEDFIDFGGDISSGKVSAYDLGDHTWLICLDTTTKTPPFHAWGLFDEEMQQSLLEVLANIPQGNQVIVANHYPLRTHRPDHNALYGRQRLEEILHLYPRIHFYLAGHEHVYSDMQDRELRMLNPGSLTLKHKAGFLILDTEKGVERHELV